MARVYLKGILSLSSGTWQNPRKVEESVTCSNGPFGTSGSWILFGILLQVLHDLA